MVSRICWSNVNLTLKSKKRDDRKILNNLSGEAEAGQLLAIMGPTGCGKTSLVSVLSGRVVQNKKLYLSGNVYYDNDFIDQANLNEKAVVVTQDDLLFSYLTVRETLSFAAYFFSPLHTTQEEIDDRVERAMTELSLTKAADTIIGSYTRRGISGGEYKRVLIGKELMKMPSVIFLDEPTSGLDSSQALSVMESMKTLANNGRIVFSVIHQPRSSIFALFDRLLLLSEGRVMYSGPANCAVDYFSRLGYVCPQHFNPADFFLDILALNLKTREQEEESRAKLDFFYSQWQTYLAVCQPEIEAARRNNSSEAKVAPHAVSAWSSSEMTPLQAVSRWCTDFQKLCQRSMAEIYRNYGALVIRVVTMLFFAVILSLIYQNIGYGQKSIQDRTGLLYFVLINQSFNPLVSALNIFPAEKKLASREIWSGAYKTSAYYLARVLCELPNQIILPIVYSTIVYWSAGLNPKYDRYLLFLAVMVMATFVSMAIGYGISAVSPSAVIANAIGPPVLIILLLFGGFYINESSLPPGSEWVPNLSLVYWGFQALVINEFAGETFQCTAADLQCVKTGQQVIDNLSFGDGSINMSFIALFVLFVGVGILGYFGLLLNREKYERLHRVDQEEPGDREVENEEFESFGRCDGREEKKSGAEDGEGYRSTAFVCYV